MRRVGSVLVHAAVICSIVAISGMAAAAGAYAQAGARGRAAAQSGETSPAPAAETEIYLPLVSKLPAPTAPGARWRSPLGIQPVTSLASGPMLQRATELESGWVRIARISWARLQPVEGGPIQWELLADFENELRALKRAGITPVVVINLFPRWATILPTSCGAIRAEKLPAFARFVGAVAARYSAAEFDVHDWELGNEPDVDPSLVGRDSVWGCWGDIDDPLYGGRRYGEMLNVVGPAIKAADPTAQVWVGGLLLDRPNTTDKAYGRPELFLKGILAAGAAPNFDVVGYHAYAQYRGEMVDYDTTAGWVWEEWGGRVVGKARFLRQIMAEYGVDKPLVVNELGMKWCPTNEGCPPPGAEFNQAQAYFVVRSIVRGIGGGVHGFAWFTLEGPGYRHSGLLDASGNPKPVFFAYQQLARQLKEATYVQPVDYGAGVEAFAFRRGEEQIHVIWTTHATPISITVPQTQFVRASDLYGNAVAPAVDGTDYRLTAGFAPIYVVRR